MINKFEAIGIFFCIGIMALALFLLRLDSTQEILSSVESENQLATVVATDEDTLRDTIENSMDTQGNVNKMIIDDVTLGTGSEVAVGDTVSVHYIGTLQNGQEFDNSNKRGTPFSFTVGEGRVIKGWDEGLLGMKVGGERILVIPSDMAYGANAVGPIPANSTLIFSIKLLEINN